jgi:hypothetical protein
LTAAALGEEKWTVAEGFFDHCTKIQNEKPGERKKRLEEIL